MLLFDIDVRVDDNERLVMSADTDSRNDLREALASRSFWVVLSDMLEPYFTNGGYRPFDASDGNPFVGLTSAPCIAESLDTDDDGANRIVGRFWYFPDYMVSCPIETLIEQGEVVWALGGHASASDDVAACSSTAQSTRLVRMTLRARTIVERYMEVEVPAGATAEDIAAIAHKHFQVVELEEFTPDVETFEETDHVWEELGSE